MVNSPKHADREFRRVSPIIRAAANANPATRCRRCGLTLAERRRTHPNATWDCGHPDRDIDTGYAAECSHCNRSHGATVGNRNRNGNALGL